jgi:VCBS repeat-containing protein
VKITDPAHGILSLNANGGFTYTPLSNYLGADSFTYQANDGFTNSGTTIVSLSVTNINRAPVAVADSYTLGKNTALTISGPGVLGNDSDADGDNITAIKIGDPAHGTLALNSDGGFAYTPVSNYFGADSFTYQATDGTSNSATATVSLTITNINRAPVALADNYTLGKNTSLTIPSPGVLSNDSDADGDAITAVKISDPAHGTVALNANGGFIYTPATNYFGADSFTYQATDGTSNSATATVSLSITNINRAPVANNDSYGLNKSTVLTVTSPGVLSNDTDADGDTITAIKATDPTHGTVSLNANGGFTYTPVSNYFGADSFTYRASDGLSTSAVATVSLTITNVNHAPVANNDSFTNSMNLKLTVPFTVLLTNDSDPDGDTLTVTSVSTNTTQGGKTTVTTTNLTFTPATNYAGTDTFIYTISDGHGGSSTGIVSVLLVAPQFGISAGNLVFNPQTGLFEQNVTVTNAGSATIMALQLLVANINGTNGLPKTNVYLYNATGTNAGMPYVLYNAPLNPAQTVTLALEWYDQDRRPFTNSFIAQEVAPVATGTNPVAGVLVDTKFLDSRTVPPRFVIEFASIPGRTYTVLYSSSLNGPYKAATPSITANATRTQWYDDGPPKTDSKPLTATSRFYRVVVAPLNP